MKVDESIRSELMKNLERWFEDYVDTIEDIIKRQMSQADTVEGLMEHKRSLLLSCLRLPLGWRHCYFCIRNHQTKRSCDHCKYAKYHGKCIVNEERIYSTRSKILEYITQLRSEYDLSDYETILALKEALEDLIWDRYYKHGEKYE